MADKDLRIKITTAADTTGADAAAAALRNVEGATRDAGDAQGEFNDVQGKIDDLKQRTEALLAQARAVDDLGEETEEAATASRQDTQIQIQRAQVYAQIGQALAQAGAQMDAMADGVRDRAPEMAGHLDDASTAATALGSAASGAAQGMAVGGPFGAAVGALVGVLLPSLKKAFTEAGEALANLEAAENRMISLQDDFYEMLGRKPDFEWAHDAAAAFDRAATAAGEFAAATARAKATAGPAAAADKAERDAADKQAIRGGADPIEVQRQRAQDDAAAKRAALEKESTDAVAAATIAAHVAAQARAAAEAAATANGPDSDDAKALRTRQQAAEKAAADALEEQVRTTANNASARREIAAREKDQLAELDAKKAERERAAAAKQQAMYDQHAEDNIEMEIRRQQEADGQAAEAAAMAGRNALGDSARDAAGKFNIAAGRAPNKNTRDTLRRISDSLDDGTDAREIAALQQKFEAATRGMGGATVRALQKMLTQMETQASAIEKLEAQMKNSRRAGQ